MGYVNSCVRIGLQTRCNLVELALTGIDRAMNRFRAARRELPRRLRLAHKLRLEVVTCNRRWESEPGDDPMSPTKRHVEGHLLPAERSDDPILQAIKRMMGLEPTTFCMANARDVRTRSLKPLV